MDYNRIVKEGSSGTNEDLCQVVPEHQMAWVLDGNTGVSDKTLFPKAPSDGRWFVNRINSHMLSRMGDSMSLTNLVRYAIRETTLDAVEEMAYSGHPQEMEFDSIDETLTALDLPSATIAVVDWSGLTVDVFTLGDSGVVVSKLDGASYVSQGDPKQYEAKVNDNLSEDEFNEKAKEIQRRKQIPGGYWVVGFNPIATDFGVEEKYYKDNIDGILLSTDGFTPIVNEYKIYNKWVDVIEQIRDTSLQTLVNEVREYEEENQNDRRKHDDIALVYLET